MNENAPVHQFLQHYLPTWNKGTSHLLPYLSVSEFSKGTQLIQEGQRYANQAFFIQQGAARSYYLKDGLEVCTWFAFEGDLLANLQSYLGRSANETVELLEAARLVVIDLFELKHLADTDLVTSILLRNILEEHADFLEQRLQQVQFMTGVDKYQWLLTYEPATLQRVSLTHIASYLGISRETLSRLRRP